MQESPGTCLVVAGSTSCVPRQVSLLCHSSRSYCSDDLGDAREPGAPGVIGQGLVPFEDAFAAWASRLVDVTLNSRTSFEAICD